MEGKLSFSLIKNIEAEMIICEDKITINLRAKNGGSRDSVRLENKDGKLVAVIHNKDGLYEFPLLEN